MTIKTEPAKSEPSHQKLLTIDSELSQVKIAAKAVRKISNSLSFKSVDSGQIELALVESVTNCIEHSYGYQSGNLIDIEYKISDVELEVSVIDDGPPAPKLTSKLASETDAISQLNLTELNIDSLPDSGWGVMLIKSLCDNVTYSRGNNRNILTLIFALSPRSKESHTQEA